MKYGFESGRWPRIIKKYPYDTLPVGAYLIFDDHLTGLRCYSAAVRWASRRGYKFKSKKFKSCYAIKRVA